jgi:superfamily II DNA or RNA helicase
MSSISFIDFVFAQFLPQNWQMGVSIYRSGGIAGVQVYGELVSAKVRAGIGESYDVRLKLHASGKCVQWMECTCQSYRRRNEKCGHIASFCIYLDQDRSEVLRRMNMSVGNSDKYLLNPPLTPYADKPESMRTKSEKEAALELKGELGEEVASFEKALENSFSKVIAVDFKEEIPILLLTVAVQARHKLTYRLGVDDAYRVLQSSRFDDLVPAKVSKLLGQYKAKRFFKVSRHLKNGLKISRSLSIFDDEGNEVKTLRVDEVSEMAIGKAALFLKKFGLCPFADSFGPTQFERWEEYPKEAVLDGDTAAGLFQSQFARLRETAEVRLADELEGVKVFESFGISELAIKSTGDGFLLVEPAFALAPGDNDSSYGEADVSHMTQNALLAILQARAEGRRFLATRNGWIKVSEEFDWLQGKMQNDGKLKLSTLEFIRFREQFAANSEIKGTGDVVGRIRNGLVSLESLELPSLQNTALTLRPYQEEGVKWLWWLYLNRLGGLLADEMGLGKTHQAMGLLSAIAQTEHDKLSLVVCPTSVIDHWLDKTQRFIPGTRTILYHGTSRRNYNLKEGREHTVIVTSYGILLRDIEFLAELPWAVVILDEAHLVKNHSTRTYRAACKLTSQMRLCLTGTPLENDLMELKNLFDYILPTYLGSDAEFKRKYTSQPDSKGAFAELELHRIIHPFKLRRNKKDVLTDLPDKVEDVRYCHLKKEQHRLYREALALKGAPLLDMIQAQSGPIPYIHVFSVISLLKQICDDPALVDPRYEEVGSGKLDLLDELLQEAFESDQKVVVFSQYAKMIDRLSKRLHKQGVKHVCLTGSTTNRGQVVRNFQEDDTIKVFLGSLLAGGTGIDLTAASVVIHYDRWWNAAKENQATDRIHRMGQSKNVQVYKLVCKGTLEERIHEIISQKKVLFDRFVEQDTEVFSHLSREDLLKLLAPPEEEKEFDAYEVIDIAPDEPMNAALMGPL